MNAHGVLIYYILNAIRIHLLSRHLTFGNTDRDCISLENYCT